MSVNKLLRNYPKILCCDDDIAYRRYLRHILGNQYIICFASSGKECLNIAKSEYFDLVFLDSALPDLSPAEVCEDLRDDPFYQETPIVFLSQNYSSNECQRLFACGGDDYMEKSISPNEINALLSVALEACAA